ncbi:hypothetical protein [Methanobrevibacter arboriphilus]|uniref:hypothetical protein n=1 Tax=Methanobrevibacter arboriphilus TaxID=39441 RepID=UPI000B248361|nr:hypothetical protein [Methanobrevibacter arboriphilus]
MGLKVRIQKLLFQILKDLILFLNKLESITVGGTTPMAAGLKKRFRGFKKGSQ